MALFDRFKKDKDSSVLPPEVDQYYRDERSNHRTAALLLGVATFVITLIVGSLLFFGGRAIYRAVSDDSSDQTAQPAPAANDNEGSAPAAEQNNDHQDGTDHSADENNMQDSDTSTDVPQQNDSSSSATTVPLGDDASLPATGDPGM